MFYPEGRCRFHIRNCSTADLILYQLDRDIENGKVRVANISRVMVDLEELMIDGHHSGEFFNSGPIVGDAIVGIDGDKFALDVASFAPPTSITSSSSSITSHPLWTFSIEQCVCFGLNV
jgi:hypothetical protein